MGFIFKFLVYGAIFYYLFKFLAKIFGVFIIKKASEQFTGQNQHTSSHQQNRKEGEVNIKTQPKIDKKHVKGGDYVEFEEVE